MEKSIDDEFKNLILILFKQSFNQEIVIGKYEFFIPNLHDFEYFTIENPIMGSEIGIYDK